MTTLNDMTPEALRDLMLRASATADGKEMAQQQIEKLRKEREADKEAKRKAEKDIIPPAGTFWRYNKRVWTVATNTGRTLNLLLSVDKDGRDLRYWFFNRTSKPTFSSLFSSVNQYRNEWDAGGYSFTDQLVSAYRNDAAVQATVGKLILTARDIK